MMIRWSCWSLALLMSASLLAQTAKAQPFAFAGTPRTLCVTDPYGTSFHTWYGSPVAYNSYFYSSLNSSNGSSYNATTNGYFWGGVPTVASATTSEWIVQRTSVFPINAYPPWTVGTRTFAEPWVPRIGSQRPRQHSLPTATASKATTSSEDSPILPVAGAAQTDVRGQ